MNSNPLSKLMHPESVAIVGAGNNPKKMGTLHGLNLVKEGFRGKVFPVHPKEKSVLGLPAYAGVSQLPEVPDLAILIVPAQQALPLLEQFGELGTRHAVIVTAGFRETGAEGLVMEERLKEIASRYGIRFVGPNCIGIINSEISLNTTIMPGSGKAGKLGMASQSGTYVTQTLPYLQAKGIHFSKAVSVGNEADIDIVDVLEYLGEDKQTTAVALYIEGIKDGRRFIEVAQQVTRYKPVIAQYVGGSEAGARAGMSHTGSMAGPDDLYEGVFRQAGVIRVQTVEDLYTYGWALATQPRMAGKRVAVVTNSGGPGTAIANACERAGLLVPAFSESLQQQIRERILPHASSTNPVDLTFHMDAELLAAEIPELIMQSGEADGVIIHGAMNFGMVRALYPNIRELLGNISLELLLQHYSVNRPERALTLPWRQNKPMVASSFFGREDDYTAAFLEHGIPVFDSPEKAARAMAVLSKYREIIERKEIAQVSLPQPHPEAQKIIAAATGNGLQMLDEFAAKQLLSAYGIPVVRELLVHSEEEAVAAFNSLGGSVVVKGCLPEVAHKTERGLVHLSLSSAAEVRSAYLAVTSAAGGQVPVLVAEMVQGSRELLAGVTRFPGFGPCVLLGMGGIFAEAYRDITFRVAPLSSTEAGEMLGDIAANKILGNFRGMPAVDEDALVKILTTLSLIPLLHPEIAEIDINPVMIDGTQPLAVDALIVLKSS